MGRVARYKRFSANYSTRIIGTWPNYSIIFVLIIPGGQSMLTWILVISAMLGAGLVAFILTFAIVDVEKSIQWGGKDYKEWKARGIDCPGERLPWVSFLSGTIRAAFNRSSIYLASLWVFIHRGVKPSIFPVVFVALFCILNDIQRIYQFKGSSGRPTEIGYCCGGIIAAGIYVWVYILYG